MSKKRQDVLDLDDLGLDFDPSENFLKNFSIEEEEEEEIEELEEEEEEEDQPEEKEEEESEEEEQDEEEEEETEEETSQLKILAQHFHDRGVIEFNPDEFEDTDEGFETLFVAAINKGIESYKESLTGTSKALLDYLESGGKVEEFIQVFSQKDFSELKEEDLEELDNPDEDIKRDSLRKEIIREALLIRGIPKESIEKKIQRYESAGILADEAIEAKDFVTSFRKTEKEKRILSQKEIAEENRKKVQKWKEDMATRIEENASKILGVDLTKKEIMELKDTIFVVNSKTGKTKLAEIAESDPDFIIRTAFLVNNGIEKIATKKKKEAVSTLKNKLDPNARKGASQKRQGKLTIDNNFKNFEQTLK